MKTFEQATQAMIDADREAGHIGADAPEWGRYEVMLRAALLALQKNYANPSPTYYVLNVILRGDL